MKDLTTMWHGVKTLFHVIIIFQCLLFITYLTGYKNIRNSSKWLLISFLIVNALTALGGMLSHFLELREIFLDTAPLSLYFYYPLRLASIPFIFLYILSITLKNFEFKPKHFLHFIPFILVAAYLPIKFHSMEFNVAQDLISSRNFFNNIDYNIINFINYIQFYFYALISLILIKDYRTKLKASFSSVENIYLSWPNIVIWGLIIWKTLRLIDYLLYVSIEDIDIKILYLFYIAAEITFLIFISILFLKGIKQPNVFFGILEETSKTKYEKTGLTDIQRKTYEQKLLDFMDNKKPFLDPLINIKELAKQIEIQSHHLSQVINNNFKKNFFDFINSYRIEESKKMLAEFDSQKKTILEILYECGYNSKSVFNTAFKKHTGLTPTQYRKSISMKVA